MKIPSIFHYCFGLAKDFGGIPFTYWHYLSIVSAIKFNNPKKVFFYYQYEPNGPWWEKAKPLLTLVKVTPPTEIFGNEISHYAHQADIIRLEKLIDHGGVYLDLDILCLKSFDKLRNENCVLGLQKNRGICNAVILSEQNSSFLQKWYDSYKSFDQKKWDKHSVQLPFTLSRQMPHLVTVVGSDCFFPVNYDEPWAVFDNSSFLAFRKQWSRWSRWQRYRYFLQESIGHLLPIAVKNRAFYSRYKSRFSNAYCVHLWQNLWCNELTAALDAKSIKSTKFAELVRIIDPEFWTNLEVRG